VYFEFKLKKYLEEKNISGYRLAKLANKSYQTVYRWIHNPEQISLKGYELICNVLECKLSDLIKEVD
jgi:DNA-binding Xre family transcriptional regulator